MNIQFETPERLKIQLTAADLNELGTTYGELDYASADTRKMLDDLLGRIGAKNEFKTTDRRLVIEILPAEKEGCIIFLTLVKPALKRKKADINITVWQFDSADELVEGISNLKNCKNKISLYLLDGKYRLIIQGEKEQSALLILSEYGCKVGGKNAALFTSEHGQLLSADLMGDFSRRKPT